MAEAKNIVYGLKDPRTEEVRYIGKSVHGIRRAKAHLCPSNLSKVNHKNHWIKQLIAENLTYEIVILETCLDEASVLVAEVKWIAIGRGAGWKLTNATDGGEGCSGLVVSDEGRAKMSAAHVGKKWTAESIARRSATVRGRKWSSERRAKSANIKVSDETREKLRIANSGRKLTEEHKEKLRQAHLGKTLSVEHKKKLAPP